MAYTTDLQPAWPSPFWTIPPDLQSWRRASRVVGGGAVWTPVTVDPTTNTVYFGTGSATPLYFPALRPGVNPRTDALIAVDLTTGKHEVVAAADRRQPVGVRRLAAAARLHRRRSAARRTDVVSVATMEGVWFAFDAKTGPAVPRAREGDRPRRAPTAAPGRSP